MKRKCPCLAYVHIEKAAGSTLHDVFSKNFFGYHIFRPYKFNRSLDNQSMHLTAAELKRIRLMVPFMKAFGGHSIRSYAGYEEVFEDLLYVTFLRDPVRRYYSHYLYQKEVMSVDWTLDEFIDSGHFNNFMCQRISGQSSFDAAAKELDDRFFYVGVTEEFDRSLLELKELLSRKGIRFDVHYVKKNVRSDVRGGAHYVLDQGVVNRISQANVEDVLLYDHVRQSRGVVDLLPPASSIEGRVSRKDNLLIGLNKVVGHGYVKWLEYMIRDQSKGRLTQ